ncbi:MAG: hypothetical protein QM813_17685 [Verrucomicrobiota bacterium]
MRLVFFFVMVVMLSGCSKAQKQPMPDFAAYSHLKPGTRIKVTPYIKMHGGTYPPAVRDAIRESERDHAVIGTLTHITKTELLIDPDNPDAPVGFTPEGVRSIEVLSEHSAPKP